MLRMGNLRDGSGCLLPSLMMGELKGWMRVPAVKPDDGTGSRNPMEDERSMDSHKLSSDPYNLPTNPPINAIIKILNTISYHTNNKT